MDRPLARRRRTKNPTQEKRQARFSRRTVVFVALAAVMATLSGLVGYHQHVWSQYSQRIETTYIDARQEAEQGLWSESADVTDMAQLSGRMNDIADSLCEVPLFGELRMKVAESAHQQQDVCEESATKLRHVAEAAKALRVRLGIEQELTNIYSDMQAHLGESESFEDRQQAWRDTKNKLEAIDAGVTYQEQKNAQISAIDNVIASYDGLGAANKSQKRPEFDAAIENLQLSYDAMSATAEAAKASYRHLIEDLATAVEAL